MSRNSFIRTGRFSLDLLRFAVLVGLCMFATSLAYADYNSPEPFEGAIDFAATGGTMLTDLCMPNPYAPGTCTGAPDGQGDTGIISSTAVMNGVPEDAFVVKAYLVYMADLLDNVWQPDTMVAFTPPGGETYQLFSGDPTLNEDHETLRFQDQDPLTGTYYWLNFYTYRLDITSHLRHHTQVEGLSLNGTYTFGDMDVYTGSPYLDRTTILGGWSVLIIYASDNIARKRIYYYTGFQVGHDSVINLDPSGFEVPEDPEAKITFFLGEGDVGIAGVGPGGTATHSEGLRFNGQILSDLCNPQDNPYNSTVNTNILPSEMPCRNDQYSIDLDTFDISEYLDYGDTTCSVDFTMGQDQVFTNYLIISIDTKLPDFDIPNEPEKDASVPPGESLYPGQEFKYYIYVQNNGEDAALNVRVKDALNSHLTYVENSTYVIEPSGARIAVPDNPPGQAPSINGVDVAASLPPGGIERYTVEMTVRLNTLEEGVTKETIIENTAEILSTGNDAYITNGGIPVMHSVKLESFEGKLHFSAGSRHPESRFVQPGETDVVAAHINLKALEGAVELSSFMFTPMEETDASLFKTAKLYHDVNDNGLLDDSDVQMDLEVSWLGGGLGFSDFSELPEIGKDEEHNLLLVVSVDDDAVAGMIGQLELLESNAAVRGFKYGLPFECARLYIPSADTEMSIELGYNNPADGFLAPGSTAAVMQVLMRAYSAVTVSGVTFAAEGTLYDSKEVQSVVLIDDANGNGQYDNGESQLGQPASFTSDNGTISFSGLGISMQAGDSKNLLAVVTFSQDVSADKKFRLLIDDNARIEAGGAVVFGAPLTGNLFTFADQVVECQSDDECWAALGQNWACDDFDHICISTSANSDGDQTNPGTDGDYSGPGINPDNPLNPGTDGDVTEDGSSSGCQSTSVNALWLLFLLLPVLLRRRSLRQH